MARIPTRRAANGWVLLLLAAGVVVFASIGWSGRGYYGEPLTTQALDARHARLRSSGTIGLALGLVAVALIVVNLLYLVRRRAIGATWLGSLRAWMDLHVVSGLLVGGCVVLHAAGHLRSASATAATVALAIVLATGLVGRYLLAQLPRTREGRELSLEEAHARFEELRGELAELGLPPLPERGPIEPRERSKLGSFAALLFGDANARAQHRHYVALLRERTPDRRLLRRIEPVLANLLSEWQRLSRLDELSTLMASWRFLHRWLALVMVGTAACHIALALRFGALDVARLWTELRP